MSEALWRLSFLNYEDRLSHNGFKFILFNSDSLFLSLSAESKMLWNIENSYWLFLIFFSNVKKRLNSSISKNTYTSEQMA